MPHAALSAWTDWAVHARTLRRARIREARRRAEAYALYWGTWVLWIGAAEHAAEGSVARKSKQ